MTVVVLLRSARRAYLLGTNKQTDCGDLMDYPDRPRHSDEACTMLLERFLLEPAELLAALASEGWEHSPLLHVFHPTAKQRRIESEQFRRNLASLFRKSAPESDDVDEENEEPDDTPEPPIEPAREIIELVGYALWDVFSDNHSVVDDAGTEYALGSFRGSAGVIADAINDRYPALGRAYDYIHFYMGTAMIGRRADLGPVYRWIFAGLREAGCDWIYSFPRIYLIDVRGALKDQEDDPLTYDPSEAVRAELEAAAEQEERDALRAELDRSYEEAVKRAREAPLPVTVRAYREVYGALPEGWPHR